MYLLLNTAINVQNKWFLPFEQYEFVREEMMPLVPHITRSGYSMPKDAAEQKHYVVKHEEQEYTLPADVGVITEVEIPKEWSNRNRLWYEKTTDNITDYIKAAAEYLNIEIRFRPETASWYRDNIRANDPVKIKPGAKSPKDLEQDAT